MDELKQYLESQPDITEVWLNKAGQWCFSPNDLFPIKKTRDEILSAPATDAPATDAGDSKTDKSKK